MILRAGTKSKPNNGFTLAELLVGVGVLGVLGSLVINFTGNGWRRERINSVAVDLSGWLEQIRSSAMRETNDSPSLGGCVITFSQLTSSRAGSQLASVSPTTCAPNSVFVIPAVGGNDTYSSLSSNGTSFTFTPRGTVLTTNNAIVEFRIRMDGTTELRCVRISEILGLIRIGSNSAASGALSGLSCTDYTRF